MFPKLLVVIYEAFFMGQIMMITDADTAAAQPARGRGGGTSQIPEPVACDGGALWLWFWENMQGKLRQKLG